MKPGLKPIGPARKPGLQPSLKSGSKLKPGNRPVGTTKKPVAMPKLVSRAQAQAVARATRSGRIPASERARSLGWTNVTLIVLGLLGLVWLLRPLLVNPSDAALAERLRRHSAEFQSVAVERLQADGDVLRPAYRASLRRLGLQDANVEGRERIYFPAAAWWPRVNEDVKGIVYTTRPPQPVVSSLDKLQVLRVRGERHRFFRPLGGRWYLYREIGAGRP